MQRMVPVDVAHKLYAAIRDDAAARPDADNPGELAALDIVLFELEMYA